MLQQRFDREFQQAMNTWVSEHRGVADGSQTQTPKQGSANQSMANVSLNYAQSDLRGSWIATDLSAEAVFGRVLTAQPIGATHQEILQGETTREIDELSERYQNSSVIDATPIAARTSTSEEVTSDAPPAPARSELSVAAQKIIDSVADNESPKFKNSAFLSMMRGLAKEEIVLEGQDFVRRESTSPPVGHDSHVTGSTSSTQQVSTFFVVVDEEKGAWVFRKRKA